MSKSLNKVILLGNLGADPEVRSTPNGSRVATLSLATSRQWKGADGQKQENTAWHRVICWNNKTGQQLADVVETLLQEGRQALRRGRDRVPFLGGQGRPEALHHRDPRPRDHPLVGSR